MSIYKVGRHVTQKYKKLPRVTRRMALDLKAACNKATDGQWVGSSWTIAKVKTKYWTIRRGLERIYCINHAVTRDVISKSFLKRRHRVKP